MKNNNCDKNFWKGIQCLMLQSIKQFRLVYKRNVTACSRNSLALSLALLLSGLRATVFNHYLIEILLAPWSVKNLSLIEAYCVFLSLFYNSNRTYANSLFPFHWRLSHDGSQWNKKSQSPRTMLVWNKLLLSTNLTKKDTWERVRSMAWIKRETGGRGTMYDRKIWAKK